MKYLLWLAHDCKGIGEVANALKKQGVDVDLLLLQDGVFLLDKGCRNNEELDMVGKIYALSHHVEERGIGKRLAKDANLVDYGQMIDLIMEQYDKVISL
ncbi:MAG: sulfurtransferase complex subunit TusB [Candidatus Thorarchaeota archaeon]|nr:MAG: sulfurtransferase complex subunit TusB [Candidatus Thorarchaeota archaeon]